MSEPKFSGVWIPAPVLALPLSVSAKVAYGILASLDNEDGCYASNGYLANVLSMSERQVRSVILELENSKLIIRGQTDGRRVIRTIEKDALCKTLGVEENFLEVRRKTSTKGGGKLPPDSIGNSKGDKKIDEVPYSTPDFLEAWNEYVDYRRSMKRPLSPRTINELFKDFVTWGKVDTITALSNSIRNGWVGVFKPNGNHSFKPNNKPLTANDHKDF